MLKKKWKQFFADLRKEVKDDNVSNGAAALAFYLMLAIFPAMVFLLTLLPYLPVENIDQAINDLLRQALPEDAANLFTGVVNEVTSERRADLLSFGAVAALWAASNGMNAIMQQLNITYDVKENRPFWKVRGIALLLTLFFMVLVIGAFGLVVFGGMLQDWASAKVGNLPALLTFFSIFRWTVIALALLLGLALVYYFGPDVEQKFRFVSPGSLVGVILLAATSLIFKFYVSNFGEYSATYGSLGAVIILLLWLYVTGLIILFGSEINALYEHYLPAGKQKGEKK